MLMPKETPESWRVDNIEALLRLLWIPMSWCLGALCPIWPFNSDNADIVQRFDFCKVGIESDFELNLIWRAPDSYRRWNSCADWWNVFLCKFQSQMACLVLFTNFRFGCYVKSFCSLFLCLGKGSWRFTCKYIARVPSSSDQTDGMRWKNQSIFYSSTQAAASLHASSSHVYGQTDRWNALYKFWICWARANKRQKHDSQVAVSFTHNCI